MKTTKRVWKTVGIILASIVAAVILLVVSFIILFESLTSTKVIGNYPSPDEAHIVIVYLESGPAFSPFIVSAKVKGDGIFGKRAVYSQDNIKNADVEWLDERTVEINGVALDIYNDHYIGDD